MSWKNHARSMYLKKMISLTTSSNRNLKEEGIESATIPTEKELETKETQFTISALSPKDSAHVGRRLSRSFSKPGKEPITDQTMKVFPVVTRETHSELSKYIFKLAMKQKPISFGIWNTHANKTTGTPELASMVLGSDPSLNPYGITKLLSSPSKFLSLTSKSSQATLIGLEFQDIFLKKVIKKLKLNLKEIYTLYAIATESKAEGRGYATALVKEFEADLLGRKEFDHIKFIKIECSGGGSFATVRRVGGYELKALMFYEKPGFIYFVQVHEDGKTVKVVDVVYSKKLEKKFLPLIGAGKGFEYHEPEKILLDQIAEQADLKSTNHACFAFLIKALPSRH